MLRSEEIADRLEKGDTEEIPDPLVVVPMPDLKDLESRGSVSLDLRLGSWFVALRQARMSHLDIDIEQRQRQQLSKTSYVPFGSKFFLHPRNFVLGTTLEWIRLPRDLGGYVVGKSSWGRRGLVIATATSVHPGFAGCITLELTNVGEIPIAISPGMAICQLCLHQTLGNAPDVDQSQFVGLRKPSLGRIQPDAVAKALSKAYGGENHDTAQ